MELGMKIFVSWSGEDSRVAAELFRSWIPNVLQEVEAWVSSQDISKGEKWSAGLWESLSEIEFGVLMVTAANHAAPWILFEAGALSKTVRSRVIPILCNVDRVALGNSPLSQFQNALPKKEDIWQVVEAINSACTRSLEPQRLRSTFEKWWPDFETAFSSISFLEPSAPKATGHKADAARLDNIEKVLEVIMSQLQRMRGDLRAAELVANNRPRLSLSDLGKTLVFNPPLHPQPKPNRGIAGLFVDDDEGSENKQDKS
jgi:hypothetical protein